MSSHRKLVLLASVACSVATAAAAAEVKVAPYGVTKDGHAVQAYTLVNDKGASATILDYGGAIAAIRVPDRNGQLGNVVMSFADLPAWETVGHANSIIGRYANRIRKGFTLDGAYHPLQQNPQGITLHGGPPPYSTRVWTAEPIKRRDGAAVTLGLTSPDGDQGFPGAVKMRVTYRFTNDNTLRLTFTGTTDKPTLLNLTNHVYFNLNGNSTTPVYGERLKLEADRIAVKDAQGMPSGELKPVAGTALDLSRARPLGELAAAAADPAFAAPRPDGPPAPPAGQMRSFDHSYVFRDGANRLGRVAARLEDDTSGRTLELRTTETSIQVFIPAARNGVMSDVGKPFASGPAVALETQHLPDSPNQPAFPSTVLRPGETYRSTTEFRFGVLGR